jgi:hypothetical protein
LTIKTGDPEEIKEVKRLLLDVMVSCWNSDIQERADPKRLLKEINSNAQTYGNYYPQPFTVIFVPIVINVTKALILFYIQYPSKVWRQVNKNKYSFQNAQLILFECIII